VAEDQAVQHAGLQQLALWSGQMYIQTAAGFDFPIASHALRVQTESIAVVEGLPANASVAVTSY
jgi:hypothetical protein